MYRKIPAHALEDVIKNNLNIELIDVREKHEWDMVRIPQARLVPASSFMDHIDDIDWTKDVYILCRSGARSGRICGLLEGVGKKAINVDGSIRDLYHTGSPLLFITEQFHEEYLT